MSMHRVSAFWAAAVIFSASLPAQQQEAKSWIGVATHARQVLVTGMDGIESARTGSLEARDAGKSLAEAERLYTQIIEGAPASDDELAQLHLNRGSARLARGDAPGALFDFKRANALMPGDLVIEARIVAARGALEGQDDAGAPQSPITLGDQARALAWRGVRLVPPEWRLNAVIGAGGAFWVFVGAAVLSGGLRHGRTRRVRRACGLGAAACGVVAAGATGLTLFEYLARPPSNEVVVLASDCRAYREPGEPPADVAAASELRGEAIKRGTELVVLAAEDLAGDPDSPPAWLKVRAREAASTTAATWVRSVDVGFIDRGR